MRLPGIHSDNIGKLLCCDGVYYTVINNNGVREPLFLGEPQNIFDLEAEREQQWQRELDLAVNRKLHEFSRRLWLGKTCQKSLKGIRKIERSMCAFNVPASPDRCAQQRLKSRLLEVGHFQAAKKLRC